MVKSLAEYVSEVLKVAKLWSPSRTAQLWFRGQRLAGWHLTPSYYREFEAYIPDVENTFMTQYMLRGGRLVTVTPTRRWEWLYLMQHYGFPTRLLDWSDSALVALYFAVRDHRGPDDDDNAAVWMLDPVWLNSMSLGLATIALPDWDEVLPYFPFWKTTGALPSLPVAVEPSHVTERLTAQRGHFTIHGSEAGALNQLAPLSGRTSRCHEIVIRKGAVPRIEQELATFGVQETTIYPDLEGLSRELRRHIPRSKQVVPAVQSAQAKPRGKNRGQK